jgi:phosphoribosylamine-glycine ligase
VLYAGLMLGPDGAPSVVEFNCRLGDPEAQVVLPLVAGGLTACLQSVADGGPPLPLQLRPDAAVTTVLAAEGYPDAPRKGAAVTIPEELPEGVTVFHAGTARGDDGVLRASGGRVLTITAVAPTFAEARRRGRDRVRGEGLASRYRVARSRPGGGTGRTLMQVCRFPPQCLSCPKSKPSSAISDPPCLAAASCVRSSATTTCSVE